MIKTTLSLSKNSYRILMFLSGFLMGLVSLFIRALPNSIVAACVRGIFGFIFIFLYLVLSKKIKILKKIKKTLFWQILQGLSSAFVILCYFIGISSVGPAIAAFLLYTGGIFALIFYRFFLKITINAKNWIAFLIAIIGVAIILKPWNIIASFNYNILISLCSGVLLGINITIRKVIYIKMEKIDDSYDKSADFYIAMVLFPTLLLAILFLPFSLGEIAIFTHVNWLVAILLGLIPTAIAFTCYNMGLQGDTNGDVIILSYIEPIVASIINALILSTLEITIIIGGMIILIANIIVVFSKES